LVQVVAAALAVLVVLAAVLRLLQVRRQYLLLLVMGEEAEAQTMPTMLAGMAALPLAAPLILKVPGVAQHKLVILLAPVLVDHPFWVEALPVTVTQLIVMAAIMVVAVAVAVRAVAALRVVVVAVVVEQLFI
jgi:hypothetical protein